MAGPCLLLGLGLLIVYLFFFDFAFGLHAMISHLL